MGSWNEVDGLTSLPIFDKMPCRAMFIQKAFRRRSLVYTYPFDHFVPVSALVKGNYNDYGWMDFDSGEEQRLFDTAASIGIEARKEKEKALELPEDTYFWVIREDTFQMLDTLPIDYVGKRLIKTVGEDMARRIEKFEDFALQTVGLDPSQNWHFRDRLNQLFCSSEMPEMAIRKALFEKDGRPDAVFDHIKLFSAMLALHKCLMPTQGGSQTFLTETYKTYAAFITGACDQYIKECEEM